MPTWAPSTWCPWWSASLPTLRAQVRAVDSLFVVRRRVVAHVPDPLTKVEVLEHMAAIASRRLRPPALKAAHVALQLVLRRRLESHGRPDYQACAATLRRLLQVCGTAEEASKWVLKAECSVLDDAGATPRVESSECAFFAATAFNTGTQLYHTGNVRLAEKCMAVALKLLPHAPQLAANAAQVRDAYEIVLAKLAQ